MLQSAVAGLVAGGAYAALGVCVLMMYRVLGVLNFAQASIGCFGAFTGFELHGRGAPYGLALLVAIVAGAAVAALAGLVMTAWFGDASAEVRSTVTIAMLLALLAAGFRFFGSAGRTVPEVLPHLTWNVGGVVVSTTGLVTMVGALGLAVGVSLLLTRTRTGVLLRAVSERPVAAELLGVPVRRLSLGVWAVGGALAAAAVAMIAPNRGGDYLALNLLIIPALATALLGIVFGLAAAAVGGIAMGLLEGVITLYGNLNPYRAAVPFTVIVAVLLWTERHEVWDAAR